MQGIIFFSVCCQDLARDLFIGPTKQGNQIVPFLCYLLGLGGIKFAAIFRSTPSGKVNGERAGGVSAAKESDAMGGCTLAVFMQLFRGVTGILY